MSDSTAKIGLCWNRWITFTIDIYTPLDTRMVQLQLCHFEVFMQRNFVADFIWLNLNFVHKNNKFAFEPLLGELGVTYALHASLLESMWLTSYSRQLTFFVSCDSWDVISRYWLNSTFFKGVGHFKCKSEMEGDIAHQSLLVPEN